MLAETMFVVTTACQAGCVALRSRGQAGNPTPFTAVSAASTNPFCAPAIDLSEAIVTDLGATDGVARVGVTRQNSTFHVVVEIDRFEHDVRQKVFVKEMQLFESFPDYYFDVVVSPAS
jgi:hypothetical protein